MKSGILLLQDVPWEVLRERVAKAEDLGFETIWVADHLVEPYNPEAPWSEAWTLLGALAATTSRASIGALVSSMTLRNPTLLVQAARTLRDISGGRAELALGAGGAPLDYTMTGTRPLNARERSRRFAEFVPLVAELLQDGQTAGDSWGTEYPVANVRIGDGNGIRLTVAGLGVRSIALAARHADAWNSYGVPAGGRVTAALTDEESVALFSERKRVFDRALAEAGRAPGAVNRSYTWVQSYIEPVLSDLGRCRDVLTSFERAGVNEFVVYWPREAELEAELRPFAELVRSV